MTKVRRMVNALVVVSVKGSGTRLMDTASVRLKGSMQPSPKVASRNTKQAQSYEDLSGY